jgi:hypothetical protein
VIHWDWFWTVLLMWLPMQVASALRDIITEPARADRMRAEALLIHAKHVIKKDRAAS